MTSRVLGLLSFDIAESVAKDFKLTEVDEERCAKIVREHLTKIPISVQRMIDAMIIGPESKPVR